MEISIPAKDITPAQMRNLIYTLYSRQDVINRMTDSTCLSIPEVLVQRLKEYTPAEDFTSLLDDCRAMDELEGFDFRDGKVFMTFPFDEQKPEKWTAYAALLQRIYESAVKATRVFPERVAVNEENEKYQAHSWLQRLGYRGEQLRAERKILLGHLRGYCAFSNKEKMQAHMEKYTAQRREAIQEVTVDD